METILYIVLAVVPAAAAVGAVHLILRHHFLHLRLAQEMEWKKKTNGDYLPTAMQAYERLTLLCERMNPENLIFRINKPGTNARQLKAEMLRTLRDEFDHNLAQQLYVSSAAWKAVCDVRDKSASIIQTASETTTPDDDGIHLAAAVLNLCQHNQHLSQALGTLKSEFAKLIR